MFFVFNLSFCLLPKFIQGILKKRLSLIPLEELPSRNPFFLPKNLISLNKACHLDFFNNYVFVIFK